MGWLSVPSFIKNRRRSLAAIAGTVGTGYLITKWAVGQFQAMAANSAKGAIDYANLQRRFASAQADAEFTILALLPTLGEQVNKQVDLEGASRQLSGLVRKEREEKVEKERKDREREERAKAAELRSQCGLQDGSSNDDRQTQPTTLSVGGGSEGGDLTASMVEEGVNLSASVNETAPLNPAATPFEPSPATDNSPSNDASSPPPSSTSTSLTPYPDASSTQPSLSASTEPTKAGTRGSPNGGMSASLSKSWAQVVVSGAGEAAEATAGQADYTSPAEDVPSKSASSTPEATEPVAEPTKAELWQQIKILSFTRTLTTLYLVSLLTIQTHVQLSLLGRASYVAGVIAGVPSSNSPSASQLDLLNASAEDDLEMADLSQEIDLAQKEGCQAEVERLYLSVSWWLLHDGARQVVDKVKAAVEEVVGPLALKASITYSVLPSLLSQIRHRVEFDPTSPTAKTSFISALLPPTPQALTKTLANAAAPSSPSAPSPLASPPHQPPPPPALARLLDETADLLASADGRLVQALIMDRLIAHLVEAVEPAFKSPLGAALDASGTGSRFEDVGEREVRLASLLPVIARQGVLVLSSNPNGYVERAEEVRELHEFGAVVFGGWDRGEGDSL